MLTQKSIVKPWLLVWAVPAFDEGPINLIYKDRQICTTDGYSPRSDLIKEPALAVGVKKK